MGQDDRLEVATPPGRIPEAAFRAARRQLFGLLDEQDLSRGFSYALAERGQILAERRDGSEVELTSICAGSSPTPYTQNVLLSFDESGKLQLVEGDCSCPVEVDCKHVACVALTWLSGGQPRQAHSPGAASRKPKAPQDVVLPPDAQEWLRRFEATLARAPETPLQGDCVVYALGGLGRTLDILKGRLLKDGRLTFLGTSSPDTSWLHAGREPPRYLTRLDVAAYRAIGRLSECYAFGGGWNLEGEAGREALERALETGRLVYLDDSDRIPLERRRLELRIGAEGSLKRGSRLSAELYLFAGAGGHRWGLRTDRAVAAGLQPIPVSPPMYLDLNLDEVGDLDTGQPDAVSAQLLRMPEIEKRDAEAFFSRLAAVARDGGAEGVAQRVPPDLVLSCERPQARVRLTRGVFRGYVKGRYSEGSHWIAELWFDYPQGLSLPEGSSGAAATRWRDRDGAEKVVMRDEKTESAVRRELSAAGFPLVAGWNTRLDAQRPYMMPADGSVEAWSRVAQRFFEAAQAVGADIECDPDFPSSIREVDEIYQDLAAAGSPQWFDLELGVMIGGARVPIVGALADWIGRTRNPQEWLERTDPVTPVLLNAGAAGLIRLSAERLRQLLAPLLDTFGFERKLENGKLRLSRIEAALAASSSSRARATDDLAALRERLRDFRGLASVVPSPRFRARLRAYQQSGLDWLQFLREYGLAGILADDMGLGKTVQALAHLDLEIAAGRADRPSLVVAPTSVLPNWREEAERFAPELRVLVLHGARRGEDHARIPGADLVVTSYALLARDLEALAAHEYHLVIFDEAQFLKNARTQVRAAAAALRARHRLALTGTPIENNLAELWSHFDLLLPGFLGDSKQFARAWRTPIEREGDSARMERLARRVRPFILRRTRGEVLHDLPEKTEIVRHVELDGAQRDLYESLRIALDRKLRQTIRSKGIAGSQIVILDALLKLRQACCDPRLVKTPGAKAAHGASAKLDALREMLGELREEGKRVLLFSQFTSMLDLIEPELAPLGARHVRLDGSTTDRAAPVKRFQGGEADVFLISLRAGGTGLNLTAADTVIHYDPWWNPAVEAQATARAHRIGQDKAVFVYKLIALGTVEERILELVKRKQALADALLGEGRAGKGLITEEDVRVLLAPIGETL